MDNATQMSESELEEIRRERQLALADEEMSRERPAPVTTSAPRVVEDAPVAAESSEPGPEPLVYKTKFKLNELLALYDYGKARVPKDSVIRWRDTFSLAVQEQGVFVAAKGGEIVTLAAYWRTKNPHVDPSVSVPKWHPEGNYAYVGWTWNDAGEETMRALRDHLTTQYGIEFICHHDQRAKTRGRRRKESPLVVLDVSGGGK